MGRIAQGDQSAFADFVRRHTARSLSLAQHLAGDAAEAEEIVQEAMSRVWRFAGRWREDSEPATWLYRIIYNLAQDHFRKRRPALLPIDEAVEIADPAAGAEDVLDARQIAAEMARSIAELPLRQRAALSLCCYESRGCADTARIMGLSVSAVESLLVRARRRLRQRMGELTGEASPVPEKSALASGAGRFFRKSRQRTAGEPAAAHLPPLKAS